MRPPARPSRPPLSPSKLSLLLPPSHAHPCPGRYGAEIHEWEPLLEAARSMGVEVVGVAFHVGSGATNPAAFSHAIELARRAWDLAVAHGFDMKVGLLGRGFGGSGWGFEPCEWARCGLPCLAERTALPPVAGGVCNACGAASASSPPAPLPSPPTRQVLDIGGGFCGGRFGRDGRVDLGGVPEAVNSALAAHFPEDGELRLPLLPAAPGSPA